MSNLLGIGTANIRVTLINVKIVHKDKLYEIRKKIRQ